MPTKNQYDRQKLGSLLADQFSVIAREQALSCGLTQSAIAHRLRSDGRWRPILPGVYSTTTGTPTREQRAMAALLHVGLRGVITSAVAVRLHGLQCPDPDNKVEVLVPPRVRVQDTGFVKVTLTTRMPARVYKAKGRCP